MNTREPPEHDPVRETFTEYTNGRLRIGVIEDPDNDQAWIRSTVTLSVDL